LLTAFLANLRTMWAHMIRNEEGQGLSEYALILVFIAIVAIAALVFLGTDISSILSHVGNSL
jgi:pilus assembly protein Flp/PilA